MQGKTAQEEGIAALKALYAAGGFTIADRKYSFSKMPFKLGKKIYAYFTVIAPTLETGNLSFLDSLKFENEIEPLLMQYVLMNGFKLDTIAEHFDEFPADYTQFVMTSIQGFASPFLPESAISSPLTVAENQPSILKKPM